MPVPRPSVRGLSEDVREESPRCDSLGGRVDAKSRRVGRRMWFEATPGHVVRSQPCRWLAVTGLDHSDSEPGWFLMAGSRSDNAGQIVLSRRRRWNFPSG